MENNKIILRYLLSFILLTFWLTWLNSNVFADCILSTDQPILTLSWKDEMKIKFKTTWNCADTTNEFKIFYLKDWNYSLISSFLAGENNEMYDLKWDISDIVDWEYKIKILQDWDQKASTSTAFFTIDKTKPEIRDDFWIMPTWWEDLKWNVILKWNKDSVFDSYKLDENPISFYYSVDWWWAWEKIIENIENSWIYVWNSNKINAENILLKIVAKDLYWNENLFVWEKSFKIDNTPPKKLNFLKVDWEKFSEIKWDKRFFNHTPKISFWWFDWERVRVTVFDQKTEKIYWSTNYSWTWNVEIQLDPLDDKEYNLKILSIDDAWNRSESDESLDIIRDSISPKAPTISFAAIIANDLRVTVWDYDKKDWSWTFILMNWTKKLGEQKATNNIFNISMLPQWVYNLYVKHIDLAWNLSDSSNVKKVIFDTVWPKEVNFSIPSWVSIYWDIDLKFFAIDNVWVDKIEVFVDWRKIWETWVKNDDLRFALNSKLFKNWIHNIKAKAYDYAWNSTESQEKTFKIFNPLKPGHWANIYIKSLYDKWILKWKNNSWNVDPDAFVNKARALKIVTKFFSDKIKELWDKKVNFSDVKSWSWYEKNVQEAYKNHIITWVKKTYKLHKVSENLAKVKDKYEIINWQAILKSLWYNLKISWIYDENTKRAVANYQKKNWLKPSWSVWLDTIRFINFEPNVKNEITYIDNWLYFEPWVLVNRAEVLKMILNAAKINIEDKWWIWYKKYLDFAVKNWIISWKNTINWVTNFAMWDPVTVGEMAKMILRTKDILEK